MQPRPLNLITFQLPDEDSGTGFDLEVVGTDIKDPNASTHLQKKERQPYRFEEENRGDLRMANMLGSVSAVELKRR